MANPYNLPKREGADYFCTRVFMLVHVPGRSSGRQGSILSYTDTWGVVSSIITNVCPRRELILEAISLSRQQIHDENAKSMVLDPHPATVHAIYSGQEGLTLKKEQLA